jgi:hypothetical protein
LATNNYYISNDQFKIESSKDFGFYSAKNELNYFNGKDDTYSLNVQTSNNLSIKIKKWKTNQYSWIQSTDEKNPDDVVYKVIHLEPESYYTISVNNKTFKRIKIRADGSMTFNLKAGKNPDKIQIEKK